MLLVFATRIFLFLLSFDTDACSYCGQRNILIEFEKTEQWNLLFVASLQHKAYRHRLEKDGSQSSVSEAGTSPCLSRGKQGGDFSAGRQICAFFLTKGIIPDIDEIR